MQELLQSRNSCRPNAQENVNRSLTPRTSSSSHEIQKSERLATINNINSPARRLYTTPSDHAHSAGKHWGNPRPLMVSMWHSKSARWAATRSSERRT